MLKLTVRPGEYLLIDKEIKIVFTGGSSNNMHILVDAPKSVNVARSTALEKKGIVTASKNETKYYKDQELSLKAQEKIKAIITEERRKSQKG